MSAIIYKKISEFIDSNESLSSLKSPILEQAKLNISDDIAKGHWTTNLCLIAGNMSKQNPKDIANDLKEHLIQIKIIEKIVVAGPGFVNIFLTQEEFLKQITQLTKFESKLTPDQRERIQIEFVSANPTGPLHVGHGRGAAYGDTLIRVLKFIGHVVEGEYYINDAGRQIDILACSIGLRAYKILNENFPVSAYQGEYIVNIADKISNEIESVKDLELSLSDLPDDPEKAIDHLIDLIKDLSIKNWNKFRNTGLNWVINSIKSDLKSFNVSHDTWFLESSMGDLIDKKSEIYKSINSLDTANTYEKDNALWLKSTNFNDDKDRVLVRADGRGTYLASDVAYHKNKLDRGFNKIVNVWGSDHHGYIKRIEAAISSVGYDESQMQVQLVQFANLFEDGKKMKMSTRSGNFFTLRELIDRIGADAARFFYLSKQADQHLDFDISLAQLNNKENIYYYVQYAHARICSLEKKYLQEEDRLPRSFNSYAFNVCDPLIQKSLKFDEIIHFVAKDLEPHLIVFFLRDLAHSFHQFYNDKNILKSPKQERDNIIFSLLQIKSIIAKSLELLGIKALEEM